VRCPLQPRSGLCRLRSANVSRHRRRASVLASSHASRQPSSLGSVTAFSASTFTAIAARWALIRRSRSSHSILTIRLCTPGHYRTLRNIFGGFRRRPKRMPILGSGNAVWRPFRGITQAWPESILSARHPFRPDRIHPITRLPAWRVARASRGNSRASIPKGLSSTLRHGCNSMFRRRRKAFFSARSTRLLSMSAPPPLARRE